MTRNLLKTRLEIGEIAKILSATRGEPLLPPLGATAWAEAARKPVVQSWLPALRQLGRSELNQPLPELTDELYSEFHRNGVRLNFERVYFERRRMLARAVMCALLAPNAEEQSRWLESVVAKLRGIFDEVSWAHPAHTSVPSGKEPDRLDLFCGETANLMGEMLTLFGDALPVDLRDAIRQRLRREIFDNFLERHGAHGWSKASHNWNAVCHQGVLGAALAAEDEVERVARMLAFAARDLPVYLAGFAADGGTGEGSGYWEYGFGWFSMLNEQLEKRTEGALSLFESDPQVRAIARFGPTMLLSNGFVVNFADCSARGGGRPSLLQYLGERLGEEKCLAQARAQYRRLAKTGLNWMGQRCDVLYLTRMFLFAPDAIPPEGGEVLEDAYLPTLGLLVARGRDRAGRLWEFAAKAGHNDEHHNHNDCGSFLLHVDGERLLIEIGAPEYVQDFFGSRRYEFLAARSLGHSVPLINGCEQPAGKEFAARVIEETHAADEVRFVVELTKCYPASARLVKCVRTFRLDKKEGRLVVEDLFELEEALDVETAIITEASVTGTGRRIELATGGKRLCVTPLDEGTRVEVQSHEYSSHGGQPIAVRRIVLKPREKASHVRLAYAVNIGGESALY